MSGNLAGQPISPSVQSDVMLRLRRIEGQVRGIQKMIEDQRDCRDVVVQLAAIKASVASLNTLVAETYARDCIGRSSPLGDDELCRLLDMLKAAR